MENSLHRKIRGKLKKFNLKSRKSSLDPNLKSSETKFLIPDELCTVLNYDKVAGDLKRLNDKLCSTCNTHSCIRHKDNNYVKPITSSTLMCAMKKIDVELELPGDNEEFNISDANDFNVENTIMNSRGFLSVDESVSETVICDEIKNNFNSSKFESETSAACSPVIFKSMENSLINDDRAWDMSTTIVVNEINDESELKEPYDLGLSDIEVDKWSDKSMLELLKVPLTKESQKNTKDINNLSWCSNNSLFNKTCVPENMKHMLDVHNCIEEKEDFYGLPLTVLQLIKKYKGIDSLYDWQTECLNLPAIKSRTNLLYALPTSGGKTLVAEILILKELLCNKKNVLFILPYVSIAQEKARSLSPFAVELRFHVEEYAGSKGGYPPKKRRYKNVVYIATIEKGLGLIHSLIEYKRLSEIGLVVVDELHLIGEQNRGANLESLLTKIIFLREPIQIIGMSATIGNLSEVATFLKADTYTEDFRPVELTEYVKVLDELFKVERTSGDHVPLTFHSNLSFPYTQEMKQLDPDEIGGLVREVVPEHSCLVFCPSKKNCENVSSLICQIMDKKILEHKVEEKKSLFNALKVEGNGSICTILRKTIPFGVAYHHSGLTSAERSLLEEAFLAKTLCCICCTSTLAVGVNLPAKRVILRSPYIGINMITYSRYKQMVGRAGRAGLGESGESFLLCKPADTQKVGDLLRSSVESCESQLVGVGVYNLVLSALALSIVNTEEDMIKLFNCSLLFVQEKRANIDIRSQISDAVNQLIELGGVKSNESSLSLTPIGKAAVKGNIDLTMAKLLYTDLKVAQKSLVLVSYLHLLYLVTPYSMLGEIKMEHQIMFDMYMSLGENELQTAKVLGITEQSIVQLRKPGLKFKGESEKIFHRFYLSLILFELWNQKTIWQVSVKYNITRGTVHNFLNSASAFASSIIRFCEDLEEMWCFKTLLSEIPNRLTHCCSAELLPLMELPAVKLGRARQLFNAGYKNIADLAKANPNSLVSALDHMPRKVAHQIVAAAKLLIVTKAESLQEEAEEVLDALNS